MFGRSVSAKQANQAGFGQLQFEYIITENDLTRHATAPCCETLWTFSMILIMNVGTMMNLAQKHKFIF